MKANLSPLQWTATLLCLAYVFRSVAAVDTTTAPWTDLSSVPLSLIHSNNSFTLTWPLTSPPMSVQANTNLARGSWEPVTAPSRVVNGNYQITLTPEDQSVFYRLGASAVFVAPPPFGNDTNPGTWLQPVATLARGVAVAAAQNLPVFVAQGVYSGPTLQLSSPPVGASVSLYGQFDGTTNWLRAVSNITTIFSGDAAVVISQIAGETHFEGFEVHATVSLPGHSAYGVVVSNPAAPGVLRSPGAGAWVNSWCAVARAVKL